MQINIDNTHLIFTDVPNFITCSICFKQMLYFHLIYLLILFLTDQKQSLCNMSFHLGGGGGVNVRNYFNLIHTRLKNQILHNIFKNSLLCLPPPPNSIEINPNRALCGIRIVRYSEDFGIWVSCPLGTTWKKIILADYITLNISDAYRKCAIKHLSFNILANVSKH